MEKNRKLKRNAETLQGSMKGRNRIACEREGNRQLFTFALGEEVTCKQNRYDISC